MESPKVILDEVSFGNQKLVRHEQQVLYPALSECGQYVSVDVPDLDMPIAERSISELQEAVEAVLQMTWELYVLNEPDNMTQGAIRLREHLANTYKLV